MMRIMAYMVESLVKRNVSMLLCMEKKERI